MRTWWWKATSALRTDRKTELKSLPARQALVALAVPITLQAVLSAAVLLIDVFFVARLGTAAVAVVGLIAALLAMFHVLVNGVGIAVTAMVATAFASDEPENRRAAVGQALVATIALSFLIPVLAWPSYGPFMTAFGATQETVVLGRTYAAWVIFGSPSLIGLFVINCIMRGAGRPEIALRALIVTAVATVVLNPLLIFGWGPLPAFGLAGAGAATVLGRLAGGIYQATKLFGPQRDHMVTVTRADLRVRPAALRRLVDMSAGGTAQSAIMLIGTLFVLRMTAFYGEAAVAGYVIATRVVGFVVLPVHGISAAVLVLVGQHVLGGGRGRRRTEAVVHLGTGFALTLALALAVVVVVFAAEILGWFAAEPAATRHAERYLVIAAIFFAPQAIGSILTSAVNGASRMRSVAAAYAIAYLVCQMPLAWGLSRGLGLGESGVWIAAGLAQVALASVSLPLARRYVSRRLLAPAAFLRDTRPLRS